MPEFLKGNYELPASSKIKNQRTKSRKSLTDTMEERALAKLGGSICFVMKGKTFLWAGDQDEKAGS